MAAERLKPQKFIMKLRALLETRKIILLLFLMALGLRLVSVFTAKGIATDGCAYLWLSEALPKMVSPQYPDLVLPPLFPTLTRLFSYIFGDVELSGRMVSCLLGSLAVFPLFFLVKDIFDTKAAALTVLFYIIHPYLLQASAEALTEATYFFLLTSIAYLAWLAIQRKKILLFIPLGILLLLISFVRWEGVIPTFVVMVWLWFSRIRSLKSEWRWNLAATAICLVIFVVFASIFMASIHQSPKGLIDIRTNKVKGNFLYGKDFYQQGLKPYLQIAQRMPLRLWLNFPDALRRLAKSYYPPFLILLFFGLIRRKRLPGFRRGEIYILSFIVARFLAVTANIPITDRYLYAFIPVALCWAGVGFWEVDERLSQWALAQGTASARRRYVFASVIIMLAILGACLPKGLSPIRAHRIWQKELGHWLRENSGLEQFTIASRRPQEAFYAGANFHRFTPDSYRSSYEDIILEARQARADFLIIDKKFDIICPDFWSKFNPEDLQPVLHGIDKVAGHAKVYRLKYPSPASSNSGSH
jgi:4-amino-4-deoxy-L-arabinose transferase-like glycosyltransferase